MKRQIVIDAMGEQVRAAILENEAFTEIMHSDKDDIAGSLCIFYGKVQSIQKSMQCAFVDIGLEKNAFLPLGEKKHIRCGEELIVQVTDQQPNDDKGLKVSLDISLAGKYSVLLPNRQEILVSKKIQSGQERARLSEIGERICPDQCGIIFRTVAEGISSTELGDEITHLYRQWMEIQQAAVGRRNPGLLYRVVSLPYRLVCDLGNEQLERIVVNCSSVYEQFLAYREIGYLHQDTKIQFHNEKNGLIFDVYGLERQIDKLLKRKIWLKSGAYLIIDRCEAMTVIDVNSGKMTAGRNIEEMAYSVNCEAIDEIVRQIRLRDIGGIILIDFIDLKVHEHKEELVTRLKSAFTCDRSHVNVMGITRLGLVEITRKRMGIELHKQLCMECSYCSGHGEILNSRQIAYSALRQVKRLHYAGQRGPFMIHCSKKVYDELKKMTNPVECDLLSKEKKGSHQVKYEIEQIEDVESAQNDGAFLLPRKVNEQNEESSIP